MIEFRQRYRRPVGVSRPYCGNMSGNYSSLWIIRLLDVLISLAAKLKVIITALKWRQLMAVYPKLCDQQTGVHRSRIVEICIGFDVGRSLIQRESRVLAAATGRKNPALYTCHLVGLAVRIVLNVVNSRVWNRFSRPIFCSHLLSLLRPSIFSKRGLRR
jgi:hypothetical protein